MEDLRKHGILEDDIRYRKYRERGEVRVFFVSFHSCHVCSSSLNSCSSRSTDIDSSRSSNIGVNKWALGLRCVPDCGDEGAGKLGARDDYRCCVEHWEASAHSPWLREKEGGSNVFGHLVNRINSSCPSCERARLDPWIEGFGSHFVFLHRGPHGVPQSAQTTAAAAALGASTAEEVIRNLVHFVHLVHLCSSCACRVICSARGLAPRPQKGRQYQSHPQKRRQRQAHQP